MYCTPIEISHVEISHRESLPRELDCGWMEASSVLTRDESALGKSRGVSYDSHPLRATCNTSWVLFLAVLLARITRSRSTRNFVLERHPADLQPKLHRLPRPGAATERPSAATS